MNTYLRLVVAVFDVLPTDEFLLQHFGVSRRVGSVI